MSQQQPTLSVTDLLLKARDGDASALADVFPIIYQELRRLAQRQLRKEPDGHTLSPTALVHEAYIRLIDQTRVQWSGRAHFMAIAATEMRRILIDRARRHRSQKRGGSLARVPLEAVELASEDCVRSSELFSAVGQALDLNDSRVRALWPTPSDEWALAFAARTTVACSSRHRLSSA